MKRLLLALLITVFFIPLVYAGSWWVVDIDNRIIARCDSQPDINDLESRNEIAIYEQEDISFEEAEYRGNKIVSHIKTQAELEEEDRKAEESAEEREVSKWMRNLGIDELEKGGKVFKHIKKEE